MLTSDLYASYYGLYTPKDDTLSSRLRERALSVPWIMDVHGKNKRPLTDVQQIFCPYMVSPDNNDYY